MTTRDESWSAYLDGELGSTEAAAFDQSLTPDERRRAGAELRFERALATRLNEGTGCPDALWRQIRADIRHAERQSARPKVIRFRFAALSAAAGIAALLVVAVLVRPDRSTNPAIDAVAAARPDDAAILYHPRAVEEFGQIAAAGGDNPAAVSRFLVSMGIQVGVSALPADHTFHGHALHLAGARVRKAGDETLVDVLWSCCGKPIVVTLAARDSYAATRLDAMDPSHGVQAHAHIGAYTAAVVGEHTDPGLIELLHPI
jgi:hypothetical protein